MGDPDYFILARALHVVGVVMWIGGVAFVTTVLLPSIRKITEAHRRLVLFELFEGKFALQAKITSLLTGLSGFYILEFLDAWDRYQQLQYWWIHLMTFIWIIFTLALFVLEPLILHRKFHEQATKNSEHAFALINRVHWIALTLSLLAVLAAVGGVHGFRF